MVERLQITSVDIKKNTMRGREDGHPARLITLKPEVQVLPSQPQSNTRTRKIMSKAEDPELKFPLFTNLYKNVPYRENRIVKIECMKPAIFPRNCKDCVAYGPFISIVIEEKERNILINKVEGIICTHFNIDTDIIEVLSKELEFRKERYCNYTNYYTRLIGDDNRNVKDKNLYWKVLHRKRVEKEKEECN